jgi:hypothetical protein
MQGLRNVRRLWNAIFAARAGLLKGQPDQGQPASDLRSLAGNQSEGADLLRCRMEALHIDPRQLAQSDPVMVDGLRRLCAMCQSRGACALDLAHPSADAAWGEWREYCPNAKKLNELRIRSAMQSKSESIE